MNFITISRKIYSRFPALAAALMLMLPLGGGCAPAANAPSQQASSAESSAAPVAEVATAPDESAKPPAPSIEDMDNPMIRVRLVHTVSEIAIAASAEWGATTLDGAPALRIKPGAETRFAAKNGMVAITSLGSTIEKPAFRIKSAMPGAALEIKGVPFGVGWSWEGKQDRAYEGEFEIFALENGNIEVILIAPLEEYLLGVVPSEIGSTSPQEALRAQAVAARSEALLALISRKYAGAHHDIGSDVESQAYSGNAKRTPESDESVRATRGLAMFFDGQPLAAYYASSCGGHSDDIRNVWPDRAGEKGYWDIAGVDGPEKSAPDLTTDAGVRAWLTANPDVYCNPERYTIPEWARKNFRWEREFTADELSAFVAKQKDIGRVTAIRSIKRGPSGRMIEAEFVGEKGTLRTGPELAIRRVFDPPLRGAGFVVDVVGPDGVAIPAEAPAAGGSPAPPAKPEKFILRGAGWGHGVGMCQTGAIAQANAGRDFRTILKHYYPKAEIKAVYE